MNIALIEVRPQSNDYIAKEMAGGLGKRVRLGNNFWGQVLNKQLSSFFNAPPIILAQVAGVARQLNHPTKVYHTSRVEDVAPDTDLAVVLSSMVDYRNEVDFIKGLRAALPSLKVFVVGSFASAMPQFYEEAAHGIIQGDPETAIAQLLQQGTFVGNGASGKVFRYANPDDLNALPMVDWTPFIRNGAYAKRPFSRELGVSIQKSRGCSMTCNYCPYAAFYGKARQFDSAYTLKTIKYYYHEHKIRYFMFRDPNFGENRKDFRVFMDQIIKSGMKFSWSAEARLDTFKDADLLLMRDAGLRYLITGIESSNEALLKENLRKPYAKDDTFRKMDILQKAGVIVQGNYILGFPHETEQSVTDTIRYAMQLNSMFATFHIFTPQPGTQIFDSYKNRLLHARWEDFSYANLVWQHDTLSKEFLERTTSDAYAKYYFRPRWMVRHLGRLTRVLLK